MVWPHLDRLLALQCDDEQRHLLPDILDGAQHTHPLTEEAARQSDENAKTWVQENLAGLFSGIPDVIAGELVVREPE